MVSSQFIHYHRGALIQMILAKKIFSSVGIRTRSFSHESSALLLNHCSTPKSRKCIKKCVFDFVFFLFLGWISMNWLGHFSLQKNLLNHCQIFLGALKKKPIKTFWIVWKLKLVKRKTERNLNGQNLKAKINLLRVIPIRKSEMSGGS